MRIPTPTHWLAPVPADTMAPTVAGLGRHMPSRRSRTAATDFRGQVECAISGRGDQRGYVYVHRADMLWCAGEGEM